MCFACEDVDAHIELAVWVGDECDRCRHPPRGEQDIRREALVMNPRWTETRIDNFITTPTDMGLQKDYECLVQSLHMRVARASDDRRCPVHSPPLSHDEW